MASLFAEQQKTLFSCRPEDLEQEEGFSLRAELPIIDKGFAVGYDANSPILPFMTTVK